MQQLHTCMLDRLVERTSWTDQFFNLEALASSHFQRLTFQFVCCRSFRVRQRPCSIFTCDKQFKKWQFHFACLSLYFSAFPLANLLAPWNFDLWDLLTFLTFETFWPLRPFDLWDLLTFGTFWPLGTFDLQELLTFGNFWPYDLWNSITFWLTAWPFDLHIFRNFELLTVWPFDHDLFFLLTFWPLILTFRPFWPFDLRTFLPSGPFDLWDHFTFGTFPHLHYGSEEYPTL